MKIVIIGGSGLVGTKLAGKLTARGHQAVPASPDTGVDTLTGAGLAAVLRGAQVGQTRLQEWLSTPAARR